MHHPTPPPPARRDEATAPQLLVLKTLADPRGRAYLVFHASGCVWLELMLSGITEKVRASTFHALERRGWIEERTTWANPGVTYWMISASGREALS